MEKLPSNDTLGGVRSHSCRTLLLCCLAAWGIMGCNSETAYMRYALEEAGENRNELETVLKHYKDEPEKLAAAKFLIANMPAHYSYRTSEIDGYYKTALEILKSGKDPAWQNDTLIEITDRDYPGVERDLIQDVKIVTSEYLIYSIDHAFRQWKEREWASHLTFEEFCEWLLPYKLVEKQSLDSWRDTLTAHFTDSLSRQPRSASNFGTIFSAQDIVRNEILSKVHPYGIYTRSGHTLLSAEVLPYQTFGRCIDYVTLGVLTYRSVGIPAIIDEAPFWGRYRAGHSWYTILSDQGRELASEWDISSVPGWGFFAYERIPKVYRNTYSINRDRVMYKNKAKFVYPFELCQIDMTDKYYKTSDLKLDLLEGVRSKLKDKYVYISVFNGHATDWSVVDYGTIKRGKACFSKMGRNILYLAQGFDGKGLVPIAEPFIVEKDGSVRYVHVESDSLRTVEVRRKYYQSAGVVSMRRRLLGGMVEASNDPLFRSSEVVYRVDTLALSDKIEIHPLQAYRYWRWRSSDWTYGSVAELAFFSDREHKLHGEAIFSPNADSMVAARAFDGDYLTNFETDQPHDNWVGLDLGVPTNVSYVRLVPRSDDNDIHPDDEYELFYWNNHTWVSVGGTRLADDTRLEYNGVPQGALMWLRNRTRGWDERPFLIDSQGNVEWR